MTGQAKIVMWLGLLMIALQVVRDWPLFQEVLFSRMTTGGNSPGGGGSGSRGNPIPSNPSYGHNPFFHSK